MTRELLSVICTPSEQNGFCSCPVFGLFDYDPDGMSILSTYKYGSQVLAHESKTIKCPSIHWIGLGSSEFAEAINMNNIDGLMPLSKRDRRLASCMLNRAPFCEYGQEAGWRREMQTMLMLNFKAEIQFLECRATGLAGWIETRGSRNLQDGKFPN
jgi:meiotic recombination protein SPO11